MIRGFYSARSGLYAQQEHMNVIANNMANVNTAGYKSKKVSFTDLMYKNLNRAEAEEPANIGHGVKINKIDTMHSPGPLQPTDYYLDFAIIDEGFFAFETAAGNIQYSRAGNFIMSMDDGGTYYLAAPNGDRLLDAEGAHIEVTFDEENNPVIDPSQIGVYRFANPFGLANVGDNRFIETDTSGEPNAVELPTLKSGYLEGSGVEVAVEMVKVIESSKAFSFNSRMVQVADEVEQTVNSLR